MKATLKMKIQGFDFEFPAELRFSNDYWSAEITLTNYHWVKPNPWGAGKERKDYKVAKGGGDTLQKALEEAKNNLNEVLNLKENGIERAVHRL